MDTVKPEEQNAPQAEGEDNQAQPNESINRIDGGNNKRSNNNDDNSSSSWQAIAGVINEFLDQIFRYDLRNVLKVINVLMFVVIGINGITLHYELEKQNRNWIAAVPLMLVGFLLLSFIFVFILNV